MKTGENEGHEFVGLGYPRKLKLDYVDMYMIHMPLRLSPMMNGAPVPREHILPFDIHSVWEGMEECQNLGLAKAIGVSNFSCKKLEELLSNAKIPPAVNQVEMNPLWQQKELREFCKGHAIHVTAYSPLGANGTTWGDNRIFECDVLKKIAKAKGKTTAQVSLRWVYEQGVSLLVKSNNKERMKENLQIFDWSLTEKEALEISRLPQCKGFTFASIFGAHDVVLELDAGI
ncbi:hypothetical protein RJ640_020485 [Escallonia rubra]|uniref:NADP-dependent oxidoreductase domain-containing protein n=1 Tax=Escallonia rubra TaxID=112253 RepID=A0AA88UFN5_9ASTE|nr:hypothetical protein RJ640_020485 [Escallonia rubra]